jgi:hypothetical protein
VVLSEPSTSAASIAALTFEAVCAAGVATIMRVCVCVCLLLHVIM